MISRRTRRDDQGAVAVLVAVLALVLFGLAALVVDLGLARDTRRQAQNTADSAALAAGNALYLNGIADKSASIAAAKEYAASNFGSTAQDWADCADPGRPAGFTAVTGETACISFAGTPIIDQVRVVVPHEKVATPFGAVLGVSDVSISAAAQAALQPGGKAACGLCVIGDGEHDVQNGSITIDGADAYFNGTVDSRSNGGVTATGGGQIYLEGSSKGKGDFFPPPFFNQPAIIDPLEFLTLPPASTATLQPKTSSVCGPSGGGPGIYKDMKISKDCTITKPGLYVVTGKHHESGQTELSAHGVTFYFTCQDSSSSEPKMRNCNPEESGGDLLFTGKAEFDFSAPSSGATKGLAVIADRNNAAEFSWRGNGAAQSTGTIYMKSGTLDYRGNGNGKSMDSLVVVDDISFSGNPSETNLMYTQSLNTEIPPGALHLSR